MNMKLLSISTTTILFILTLILAITATFASAGPVKDAALDVAAKAAAVDALFKQNDHVREDGQTRKEFLVVNCVLTINVTFHIPPRILTNNRA